RHGVREVASGPDREGGAAGGQRMVDRLQQVGSPADLAEGASAESRQMASDLLGQHPRERHDLLSGTRELRPQVLLLSGDSHRTGVEVALADHLAAEGQERKSPEPESL